MEITGDAINLTHINENTYTFYRYIPYDEKFILDAILSFTKNGKKSILYKKKEIYCKTRMDGKETIYNYDTNEYESIIIPESIKEQLKKYSMGELVYKGLK